MVPKKDDKVRMCVDYRDLNRASPKFDFSLPHIDVLVDNTVQHKVFSFMDGVIGGSGTDYLTLVREMSRKQ